MMTETNIFEIVHRGTGQWISRYRLYRCQYDWADEQRIMAHVRFVWIENQRIIIIDGVSKWKLMMDKSLQNLERAMSYPPY